ncbi:MAG: NIPSNAP family protein [Pseudomonadota bacterium]
MILELRTYDFAPGDALRYLGLFAPEGLPLITRHVHLVGYWMVELGPLNRLRHLYVHPDLDARTERRARLIADRDWTDGFLPRGMALIGRQATQLIAPDTLSDAARTVLAAPHAPLRAHDGPAVGDGWAALSTAPLADAHFTGTVTAGEAVGTTLSIAPRPDTPALELMRPCAFSPL